MHFFSLYVVMWHGRHIYRSAEALEPFLRAWAHALTTIGHPPFRGRAWAEHSCVTRPGTGACARPVLYRIHLWLLSRHGNVLHWAAFAQGHVIERFRTFIGG